MTESKLMMVFIENDENKSKKLRTDFEINYVWLKFKILPRQNIIHDP